MVELVDMSVQWPPVECLVCCKAVMRSDREKARVDLTYVVEEIFEDKEYCNLRDHRLQRWKRDMPCLHAKTIRDGMESPNLKSKWDQNLGEVRLILLTAGKSTMKWEKRTCFVHSHCCCGVGTFFDCNFHL
jgi:hypothetical protein